MTQDQVAIVAPSTDSHAAAVAWGLRKCGVNSSIISPAELTTGKISLNIDNEHTSILLQRVDDKSIDVLNFKGFWFRDASPIPECCTQLHPADVENAQNDWRAHFRSLMLLIANAGIYSLNHPYSKLFEDKKPVQLQLAKQAGLKVPKTYVGNDVAALRSMFMQNSTLLFKTLTPNTWTPDEVSGNVKASFVHLVERDSSIWNNLYFCPVIVQEYVPKKYEVRLTVIGNTLIATGIHSQRYEFSKIDWRDPRIYTKLDSFFLIKDIPIQVQAGVLKYCELVGVEFCALDFIVTPSNEWIFLEGNNSGQFVFCEAMVPEANILETFCKYFGRKSGFEPTNIPVLYAEFLKSPENVEVQSKIMRS